MQVHHIQAFTYELREGLLPQLTRRLTASGAWVVDQKDLSDTAIELLIEIHVGAALDVYAALAAAGIELTRSGEQSLTAVCARSRYPRNRHIGEVVTVRLALRFLDDVPLQSLLTKCSSTT